MEKSYILVVGIWTEGLDAIVQVDYLARMLHSHDLARRQLIVGSGVGALLLGWKEILEAEHLSTYTPPAPLEGVNQKSDMLSG